MQVWAVYLPSSSTFSEEIARQSFQRALLLIDLDSQDRIKRFYRREDACRCLLGRLLPRMLLKENGVSPDTIAFASSDTGKPYISTPSIIPIGFNISHDNAFTVMGFSTENLTHPPYQIGIDIMKVRLPGQETFAKFVNTMGDQLTAHERQALFGVSQDEGLRMFYWIWVVKEAYTKALGLGLGFDFGRLEFKVINSKDVFTVDGEPPKGWCFRKFELNDSDDLYLGVAAEFVGGDQTEFLTSTDHSWLTKYDAVTFIERAIHELN